MSKTVARRLKQVKLRITRELLEELYWRKGLTAREIGRRVGVSHPTILRWMKQYGVKRRPPSRKPELKVTKQTLKKLYWGRGLSLRKIGEKLGENRGKPYCHKMVNRWMIKLGIPRRPEGFRLKYPKTSFSGDIVEKAYLLGLRIGDLSVQRSRRQIMIKVSTTHPAMTRLFRTIFKAYGHISKYPEFNKRTYYWTVYGIFNEPFKFLLQKPKQIPAEIFEDDTAFFAFLAGYTDAEGSLIISHSGEYMEFVYEVGSEDLDILNGMKEKLTTMHYHPRLCLKERKGTRMGLSALKNDLWQLKLGRKNDVLQLIHSLPIKHDEKLRWRRLMQEFRNFKKWSQVKDKVVELRKRIREEVKQYVREAAVEYQKKHPEIPYANPFKERRVSLAQSFLFQS